MAITSRFYDTTPGVGITETEWAQNRFGGALYGVKGAGDWLVSAVAGQDRTVSIAAGSGFGHGVADTSDANVTIQLDVIGSGSRWDLIAMRRDWQPAAGGPSAFVKVTGAGAKAIPAGRLNNPGVQDDQPIALVQVTAGQTQPTAIVDLRCWASNNGLVAADDLARTGYLASPGARVLVGAKDWAFLPAANNTFAWVDLTAPGADVNLDYGNGSTKYGSFPVPKLRMVSPGHVRVEGMFKPGTSADGASLLGTPDALESSYAPPVEINKGVDYRTTSATYGRALVKVTTNGSFLFYGLPSTTDYVTLDLGWFR